MTDWSALALAAAAGVLLGLFFFGGLWWTVRRGLSTPHPALLFTGSLILRLGVAAGGFYLVGGDDWRRLVACLVGFLLARVLVTRWTRRYAPAANARKEAEWS